MRQSCRWVGEISPPLHLHSKQSLLCIKYSLWQRQHRNHTLAVTLTRLVNLYRGAIGQLVQQSDKIGLKIWRRQNLYVETGKKCHMVIYFLICLALKNNPPTVWTLFWHTKTTQTTQKTTKSLLRRPLTRLSKTQLHKANVRPHSCHYQTTVPSFSLLWRPATEHTPNCVTASQLARELTATPHAERICLKTHPWVPARHL